MYSKLPNLVLGFHGCHKDVFDSVVKGGQHLKRSENEYDWLGNGIYFWENSPERALDWAKSRYKDEACVVGAVIEQIHKYYKLNNFETYDSIRGIFTEGKEVYPGSGFVEKTHVQLCIVNPNCIKGYFAPMPYNSEYRIP
ncbi:MAG: hypothetical protein IKH71_05585 [Oscillospiraceae bacterium]|nr:hypothetical protein [Oscillospiraceae bacterium]MBR6836380.1 hypothetical protein [Oscillospiraceae bacterium]